jgi:hypothetical protein
MDASSGAAIRARASSREAGATECRQTAALADAAVGRYTGGLQSRDASMNRNLLFAAFWSLTITCTTSAIAQDISRKATEAEKLLAQGKGIEAIGALDDAANALWDKVPLSFRRALWVVQPGTGFGGYNPRENAVFASGAPMLVYAEPVGFGWRQTGEMWGTDMLADLTIKSADGKEQLFHKEGFQKLELTSRQRNREFMLNLTYTLTGIPKGDYLAETTLRDQVTGKKGSVTLPFTIR